VLPRVDAGLHNDLKEFRRKPLGFMAEIEFRAEAGEIVSRVGWRDFELEFTDEMPVGALDADFVVESTDLCEGFEILWEAGLPDRGVDGGGRDAFVTPAGKEVLITGAAADDGGNVMVIVGEIESSGHTLDF
jgi:hypothetical protein